MRALHVVGVASLVFALQGCSSDSIDEPRHSVDDRSPVGSFPTPAPELSERDVDIIRYVLENDIQRPADRIYFLTLTPMESWGEAGEWTDVPESLRVAVPTIMKKFRLAHDAYLKDRRVLVKGTGDEAWMKWITIKKWISDTEVEVEEGVWCCPLGGGASTITYEKVDGTWRIKSLGRSWIS